MNIRTTLIDGDDPMEMEEALTEETQLLVLESPSSVVFHVQDIERAAEAAHKKELLSILIIHSVRRFTRIQSRWEQIL